MENAKIKQEKETKSIMEQYLAKAEPSQEDNENAYSKMIQLPGFSPWDSWVPMPFPHRELTYARGMYMRGEQLTVQTPEFEVFANNIGNITSRNELIFKTKKFCLERGFRSKLSMATTSETKSIHIIFLCNRSGKSSLKCKNPSVKGLCPFLLHYERKSQIGINKSFRHAAVTYPAANSDQFDPRKKYKAIGAAYEELFKSPPPTAIVKAELP